MQTGLWQRTPRNAHNQIAHVRAQTPPVKVSLLRILEENRVKRKLHFNEERLFDGLNVWVAFIYILSDVAFDFIFQAQILGATHAHSNGIVIP